MQDLGEGPKPQSVAEGVSPLSAPPTDSLTLNTNASEQSITSNVATETSVLTNSDGLPPAIGVPEAPQNQVGEGALIATSHADVPAPQPLAGIEGTTQIGNTSAVGETPVIQPEAKVQPTLPESVPAEVVSSVSGDVIGSSATMSETTSNPVTVTQPEAVLPMNTPVESESTPRENPKPELDAPKPIGDVMPLDVNTVTEQSPISETATAGLQANIDIDTVSDALPHTDTQVGSVSQMSVSPETPAQPGDEAPQSQVPDIHTPEVTASGVNETPVDTLTSSVNPVVEEPASSVGVDGQNPTVSESNLIAATPEVATASLPVEPTQETTQEPIPATPESTLPPSQPVDASVAENTAPVSEVHQPEVTQPTLNTESTPRQAEVSSPLPQPEQTPVAQPEVPSVTPTPDVQPSPPNLTSGGDNTPATSVQPENKNETDKPWWKLW